MSSLVTEADDARYSDFVRHHTNELSRRRMPVTSLHHYTSGENLIAVIETGAMWTTQIACLNDAKELIHAVDIFDEVVAGAKVTCDNANFSLVLTEISRRLDNVSVEQASAFVACFSQVHDDLSQWRAYGGYSLDFDYDELRQAIASQGDYLLPVIYSDQDKNDLMKDILKWTREFFELGIKEKGISDITQWAADFLDRWLAHLSFLAPMLKHRSFHSEHEWRLVHHFTGADVPRVKFRERQTMMRRHLPLKFSDPDANGHASIPIKHITVGPKEHQKLTKVAVSDLLASRGYDLNKCPVMISDIPFRSS